MSGLNGSSYGSWVDVPREVLNEYIDRQVVSGDQLMMAKLFLKKDAFVAEHRHPNEQFTYILSGKVLFRYGLNMEKEAIVAAGEILHIPANVPHSALCLEDAVDLDVFTPLREDWLKAGGNDYFSGRT
ncbi:cupin domain-containing protein [Pseudomonas sp. Tul1A2]